jgi:hypothetical protein
VSALDVLILINYINSYPGVSSLPAPPQLPPPYLDVDNDNACTALDVLMVVNHINRQVFGSGEPEPAPLPLATSPTEAASSGWEHSSTPGVARAQIEAQAAPVIERHESGPADWWSNLPERERKMIYLHSVNYRSLDFMISPGLESEDLEEVFDEIAADLARVWAANRRRTA